jgi:hypothetical protein
MAKFELKIKAYELRRRGESIGDIAKKLEVAKSTVSVWCRNLELSAVQENRIKENAYKKGHRGRLIGAQRNREKKLLRVKEAQTKAKKMVSEISDRDRFMLGIGLYWGEGVKADQSTLAFVNSDVKSLIFMKCWFQDFFGVNDDCFNPYIFITEQHRHRERTIRKYWSQQLNLPLDQFKKVIYLKSSPKKVYENHQIYYGTVALRIKKSTDLKYLILGLVKYV